MKTSPIIYLVITTIALVTVAIFAALGIAFHWIFVITIIGEMLLLYSVFKILKDNYKTDKTFKHFYEDFPINNEEN